jgi:hypothetical protein
MEYQISEPRFLRNLVVYPVAVENGGGTAPQTVEEALKSGQGFFRERDLPDLNAVVFDNGTDQPVFLLDGEEITGSLQNRIITASRLVEARTAEEIGVVCVEEKRWDEIGGFKTGSCSYPRVRSILAQSRHGKTDLQQAIWEEVDRKLTVTRTRSATSSMHDVYDNLQDELDRYLEGFTGLNHGTVGFVAAAGGRILGADLFGSRALYRKMEAKLLRSYALDAIEFRGAGREMIDPAGFLATLTAVIARKRSRGKYRSRGFQEGGLSGQTLLIRDGLIHVSAFPR